MSRGFKAISRSLPLELREVSASAAAAALALTSLNSKGRDLETTNSQKGVFYMELIADPIDVVISFDTTGSMSSVLAQVRSKIKQTVERLMGELPDIHIGIIVHGDYCDEPDSVHRRG